jgi:aryl-alcohol dehydrogenase-like predicted oxidoreductase
MQEVTLGRTGLRGWRIASGTWQLGGDCGMTDVAGATAGIKAAVDHGVTMIGAARANGLGAPERLLATALRGRHRDGLVNLS